MYNCNGDVLYFCTLFITRLQCFFQQFISPNDNTYYLTLK